MNNQSTESLTDLINANIDVLSSAMTKALSPIFDASIPSKYDHLLDRHVKLERPMLPKQAEVCCAIEETLLTKKAVIASLDTGFGKTQVAISIASAEQYEKILILSPPHLVKKWAREIEVILGKSFDYSIIEVTSYKDFQKPITGKVFYIVSKNINANSYKSVPVYNSRTRLRKEETKGAISGQKHMRRWRVTEFNCPDCDAIIAEQPTEEIEVYPKPNKKLPTTCKSCGGKLVTSVKGKMGPAEYASRYLKSNYFDLLIVDELHEEKSKDSLRSKAFGSLISKSKKVVGLTGTFLGGYASHAFYTLFRLFPTQFKDELELDCSEVKAFVETFGGQEKLFEIEKTTDPLAHVNRTGRSFGVKERADLSPRLLDILLPFIVFGRLDEIKYVDDDLRLPAYQEISHQVPLEDEIAEKYTEYCMSLAKAASYELKELQDRTVFSRLKVDALLVPDLPHRRCEVEVSTEFGPSKVIYEGVDLGTTNKERKLISIIDEAKANKRKVLVYHDFINSGLREHLIQKIETLTTCKVAELTTAIPANKRESFLESLECDVLLTNPELVKTGLDLLEYPTIVFYQQSYSSYNVFTLRQASKRAWRLGQTEDCEVHSIAYAGCMQAKCLQLMGAKINISQGVEGKLSTGDDLASEAEDENIQIAMARAILANEKVDNEEASTSSIIDYNSRDWSEFESYYLDKLQHYSPVVSSDEEPITVDLLVEEAPSVDAIISADTVETSDTDEYIDTVNITENLVSIEANECSSLNVAKTIIETKPVVANVSSDETPIQTSIVKSKNGSNQICFVF
jgi:hypothetical protein